MLPRRPMPAPQHPPVHPPPTVAQVADELVTLPAITAWVVAQPGATPLVTPQRPCLVATALTAQLRAAGWDVRVSTSYCTATVRDQQDWLLAQPWFPADVHLVIQLLDTAAQRDPASTLSRETCLSVIDPLGLSHAGGFQEQATR